MDNNNKNVIILECGGANRICEIMGDASIVVPNDPRIDMSVITADDNDPKFVIVEVLRAGLSKGNNRRYTNYIVAEVNELAPGSQGFFGHPDPTKFGFEFREPHSICVGSMIEHMPDGLDRCIAKIYLFKTSPLREWVPKSIAAGNPLTVSINAVGDIMRNGDIIDVVHISTLQSIDWANPGTEGMETSKAMSVVTEMNNNEGGNNMPELNVQDIMKNVSVAELKAFNQPVVEGILKATTIAELQAVNPTLVGAIIESGKITEMKLTIGGKEETVKITELQSKIDGYESEIKSVKEGIELAKITEYKTRKIGEQVPEGTLRDKISARVTGKTEAEVDASITSEISYIREMGGLDNLPVGRRMQTDSSAEILDSVKSLFCGSTKK